MALYINDKPFPTLEKNIEKIFRANDGAIFGQHKKDTDSISADEAVLDGALTSRLVMTQRLEDSSSTQLLLIGMNPSTANTFDVKTSEEDHPESDSTARLVYKWYKEGIYKELGPLGRITMLNLIPVIRTNSAEVENLLAEIDQNNLFLYLLERLVTAVTAANEGKTHVLRMWGSSQGQGKEWKVPFIELLEDGDSHNPGLLTKNGLDSVWDFRISKQPSYPPHVLTANRNKINGLIRARW